MKRSKGQIAAETARRRRMVLVLVTAGLLQAPAGAAPGQVQPSSPSAPEAGEAASQPAGAEQVPSPAGPGPIGEGDRLFREKRWSEALRVYEQQLAAQPAHLEARYKRGVVLALVGRLEEAVEDWEEVVARQPEAAPAREALLLARWKKAREEQQRAADLADRAKLEQAGGLLEAGSYAPAREVLMLVSPQGALYRDWLILEGQALLGLGKPELAIEAFQAAVGQGAKGAPALLGLGDAWLALGRNERAAWCYELALTVAAGTTALAEPQQRRVRQILHRLAAAGEEPAPTTER
ncbi:MAG: tetratricopeptide repeat protein [Deltaproteobacteria bacterium]|nr:tetratricopeptide repeat protein [Deltaproteobacteria bacterium]